MSELKGLLPEQVELVASLPFRVGSWMSHIDDEPGHVDDIRERDALEAMLVEISKIKGRSRFVREVITLTIRNKKRWPRWSKQIDNIMADSTNAMNFLSGYLADQDLREYRRALIQVAKAVAEAHAERGTAGYEAQQNTIPSENILGNFFSGIVGKFRADDDDDSGAQNISNVEREGLKQLAAALALPTKGA